MQLGATRYQGSGFFVKFARVLSAKFHLVQYGAPAIVGVVFKEHCCGP